jgi:hypothetical protein
MTQKQKIIDRINKQFNLNIPLDYPIRTHQRKFADSGEYNWYLNGNDIEYNRYGGCISITKLLKWKGDFTVCEENNFIELIDE